MVTIQKGKYHYILRYASLLCLLFICVGGKGVKKKSEYDARKEYNHLFQYSVITALQQGNFETNEFTCRQLKAKGDLGIGTFNYLDGELILLGGTIYQAKSSGVVATVSDSVLSPFNAATFFKADSSFRLEHISMQQFELIVNKVLKQNQIYAFKILGSFDTLNFRSVPKQSRPYATLSDAAKNQSLFSMHSQNGTMVGFFTPEYLSNLNVSGFHFHFITDDRNKGGHVLRFYINSALVEIASMKSIQIKIPYSNDFSKKNISCADKQELYKAEH